MRGQSTARAELVMERESADDRIWIAHGYGVKLTIDRGQLLLADGVGAYRRERRVPKIDRTLRRIIITGNTGYLSLGALRWCREHQISIVLVNTLGEATSLYPAESPADAPTLREQVSCGPGGRREATGLEIARMLTSRKLARQAEVAWNVLDAESTAREIRRVARFADKAATVKELGLLEAESARRYYNAWSDVSIRWAQSDLSKVPEHWLTYTGRKNPLANGNRHAIHPVNAILNYAYRMLEIEATLACHAAGLNPTIGFIHADRYDRDSLALDIMECVRPEVDTFVLNMLAHRENNSPRIFSRREFNDSDSKNYPPGTVRLLAPLTHEIAEQSVSWSASLYEIAEEIARMIAHNSAIRVIAREATADVVMMRKVVMPVQIPGAIDILPDDLWSQIASLAATLPQPKAEARTPAHRQVIAAIACQRIYRISREKVGPVYGISPNTLDRRFREWRTLHNWHKIEAVIGEALSEPNSL